MAAPSTLPPRSRAPSHASVGKSGRTSSAHSSTSSSSGGGSGGGGAGTSSSQRVTSGRSASGASTQQASAGPLGAITNRPRGSFIGHRSSQGGEGGGGANSMAPANKRPSAGSMAPPVSKSGLYAGLASVDRGAEQDSERGPRKPSNPSGPSGSTSRLASANSNAAGGGNRVPSVLRRLPPGAVPRSAVPSLSHTHDGDASLRQPSSSSGSSSSAGTSGGLHGGTRAPAVAALARANQRGPRSSLGASINAAANGAVVQHDRDGREVVKLNVDSTSFEEWMKMATDNKINATNTWNFALIDYFHDMSLLRSDTGDGSINFQKASCTLDGCVKVWTSRVDSVVVETGKLLSGLQDDGKDAAGKGARGRRAGEDEEGEGDEDGEGTGAGRKKRSRAREPTLAKSFAQLAVKKLDLEFTVDPLFKKTSADFDEGGAGGLLMNHLGVDSQARVVFDASDVPGQDDIDEDGVADGEDNSDVTEAGIEREDEDHVDLQKIRNKLFGQFDAIGEEDPLDALLNGMTICPTFASFRFAPDDKTPFSHIVNGNHEEAAQFGGGSVAEMQDWNDDFNDYPAYEDDGMDDAFGDAGVGAGGLFGSHAGDGAFDMQDGAFEAADHGEDVFGGLGDVGMPTKSLDFTQSLQGIADGQQLGAGDDFFGYFDQRLTKNWAGPEHWKMRNVGLAALQGQTVGERQTAGRKSKEPFVIDFTSPEGAVGSKELFETARGQTAALLPASKENSEDLYLLPEDRHFSSRQLLRLFIKPRATLHFRRRGTQATGGNVPADASTSSWLHGQGLGGDGVDDFASAGLGLQFGDEDNGMPEVPFDTQFFHEDDNGFDMDEGADRALALEPEDEEELATQALKRIRPEFVNYAKKAKRVDVRKLKENIWKELGIVLNKDGNDDDDSEEEEELLEEETASPEIAVVKRDPTEPRVFDNVLAGLRKLYPKDRMDEISTSFCFICLLHLANEEGLQIKSKAAEVPQEASGGLGMLAGQPIVEDDEDEGAEEEDGDVPHSRRGQSAAPPPATPAQHLPSRRRTGTLGVHEGEDDEQGLENVGFLEQLSIAKDPNAGRSA